MNPTNQENKNTTNHSAPPSQSHATATSSSQNSAGQEKQPRFQSTITNLPKGGGATQYIDKKNQANPVTGTGSMSVSIAISPGR